MLTNSLFNRSYSLTYVWSITIPTDEWSAFLVVKVNQYHDHSFRCPPLVLVKHWVVTEFRYPLITSYVSPRGTRTDIVFSLFSCDIQISVDSLVADLMLFYQWHGIEKKTRENRSKKNKMLRSKNYQKNKLIYEIKIDVWVDLFLNKTV